MIVPFLLAAAQAMTFTADRIAADSATRALTATGHIVAVSGPMTVRGEYMTRDADGTMLFHNPVCATTCTNAVGHTHWGVSGEVEYKDREYVILRNASLRFCEIPVMWLPYLYYPLTSRDCGFSWMPGYTGRWGAYLLTKYAYDILGDPEHGADTSWLRGATRFDLRYRQGVALGEDLDWNLGDFGRGDFSIYYVWDASVDEYSGEYPRDYADPYYSLNWGTPIERDRYSIGFNHQLDPTERDTIRMTATLLSDSYFPSDFNRSAMFNWKGPWIGGANSGLFWEHVENSFAVGAEVSGRLNDFYAMTDRLPEFYVDVNPQPLFGLPVNYESDNRIGYLRRNPAKNGIGNPYSAYTFNPGPWASYETFRLDTYHRLTAPFRTACDVLSVVPRVGYRGTYWNRSGRDNLTGWGDTGDEGSLFRSILEGGVTFAGRGTGLVDDKWRHMIEPYFDILAQKAWYAGTGRPYVFDSIDASVMWEDQFAGRARNLPYTYYGVTPGARNAWEKADERGNFREIVDFDVYAALQFNPADHLGTDDAHMLADVGDPNYVKNGCFVMPGARIRWNPDSDVSLVGRAEYDSDNNRVPVADAGWVHRLSRTFNYKVTYSLRDFRIWDFSSAPRPRHPRERMTSDDFNYAKMHLVDVSFEQQPLDWFVWSPFLRWDIRDNELESIGAWFDYLTDCLGFRFIVQYVNSYERMDGFEYGDDWSFGFYIYLRAFGADSSNPLSNWQ